jgi:CMP-2-keto-3-deoxyoctulosonic acid synthetase
MKKFESKIISEKKQSLEERFHPKDDLLIGLTFDDLIVAVQSNEPVINEASVKKTFETLVKEIISDARYELKTNMKQIISDAR